MEEYSPAKLHVLDCSALNDLVEPGAAVARHRVLEEVKAGRLLVPVTHPLLWEMVPTRALDDAKYRRLSDLAGRLSREYWQFDLWQRRVLELRVRRALTLREVLNQNEVFLQVYDAPTVDQAAAQYEGFARGSAFAEAEKVQLSLDALDDLARKHLGYEGHDPREAWHRPVKDANRSEKYALSFAERFARGEIEMFARRLGIDARGIEPRALPTFWSCALIHVARLRELLVARQSPTSSKAPNQTDVIHLKEAAAYAEVFVTSDKRLRSFSKKVRELTCEVLSFGEWVTRIQTQSD